MTTPRWQGHFWQGDTLGFPHRHQLTGDNRCFRGYDVAASDASRRHDWCGHSFHSWCGWRCAGSWSGTVWTRFGVWRFTTPNSSLLSCTASPSLSSPRSRATVAPPRFCNRGGSEVWVYRGLEYEVPQSRLYCLCINVALCSTALQCICRVIRRSSRTMKAHTYYIIFVRPPIGGKLPPSPPWRRHWPATTTLQLLHY